MMTARQAVVAAVAAVSAVLAVVVIPNLFESLDAHEIMVIQSPMAGTLTVYTDPGIKWQGFGKVTKYPRRAQYTFCSATAIDNKNQPYEEVCNGAEGPAKRLRFNDGGHANLNGAISWEMPLAEKDIIAIHKQFGNAAGVESAAVAKMIDSAVYLAGPLMSSTESSGERRAELVQVINDQAENGVYVTHVVEKEVIDSITGQKKLASVTAIDRDEKGNPKRQQGSILAEFNIKLMPMAINELKYDQIVEAQIAERQKATTAVQTAIAQAKTAEQDAITIAKKGEATAAKAKWDQETINAKEIAQAEKDKRVAQLGAETAEQLKRKLILEGEGEAAKRQLVMNADGALDTKLKAYIEVNKQYAEAIKSAAPGAWTPTVVMGSTSGGNAGGAQALMDMFAARTARDLGVDLQAAGAARTSKK